MGDTQHRRPCEVEEVGKGRNGRPRYWCKTHGASATGRYGAKLAECEGAYLDPIKGDSFDLDETSYPGGVALWGAVAPVYDTARYPTTPGIHVHARLIPRGEKVVDQTYSAVVMRYQPSLLQAERIAHITATTAVNYYVSRYLNRDVRHLFCMYCGEIHLDSDYFAVHPHKRHLCHGCGKLFQDTAPGVSNPIALLRAKRNELDKAPIRPERSLDVRQADYPGGIQIWASNPAFLWTAAKPEEEGIHVHLFDGEMDKPAIDDTFDSVRIDGVQLDERQIRHLMAQQSLPYLKNKVVSLHCPQCGAAHFDDGESGFHPHNERRCKRCQEVFEVAGKRKLVVSNPLVDVLAKLQAASPPMGEQ